MSGTAIRPAPGDPAPDFTLPDADATPVSLAGRVEGVAEVAESRAKSGHRLRPGQAERAVAARAA